MIRLALRVLREDAEVALAELLSLAPGGVEEVDPPDDPRVVEYAVYGAPGELPSLPDLHAAARGALVDVRTTEVADDWADRWREFHRPVRAGSLFVRAPWHDPVPDAPVEVVVDPGQAFGTGAHATTRLCLELLSELEPVGSLVDAGCGSGVLAIAAAKLGWSPVVALDYEREAVEAARSNAVANGVDVEVRRWDLRSEPVPAADAVVGNLLRPLLLALEFSRVPRVLVASGLLAGEGGEVAAVLAARLGLRERARREADGWVAALLERRE